VAKKNGRGVLAQILFVSFWWKIAPAAGLFVTVQNEQIENLYFLGRWHCCCFIMTALARATALSAAVWVCCISESQAFVPSNIQGTRDVVFTRRILLQSSVGYGEYSHGYNPMRYGGRANYTAMDVLASLNFVGNEKYREVCAQTTRINVDDAQVNLMETIGAEPQVHQVSAKDASESEESELSNDDADSKNVPSVGIGGEGGTVYDVNKLKRNLVQEMFKNYKEEMWDDLGKPEADFSSVEDKLASLVQSNAVKCTTDSNLLDGRWTFAFGSRQTASALMDSNRFDIAARRTALTQAVHAAKVDGPCRSSSRIFCLESMEEDEDVHVLDCTQLLGGIVSIVRRYNVTRLTRTSLNLQLYHEQTSLFGKQLFQKELQEKPVDLRILYVDNDLCISATNDLAVSPFSVYTKSHAWVGRSQRRKRQARRVLNVMRRLRDSFLTVLFLRKRVWSAIRPKKVIDDASGARILVALDDKTKKLTVLKLGDLENDLNAWEGEDDPFVHLSAVERQEKLKTMRVRDIEHAGRRERNRKGKKKRRAEKRKDFKKPE
jgi:hypothetical protein